MHTPHISAYSEPREFPQPQGADVVYRGLTVVAMLLLLASLWVF
jgi:hypothetical protein